MKSISAKLRAFAIISAVALVVTADSSAQIDALSATRSASSHLPSGTANQHLEFEVASVREVAPHSAYAGNVDLDPSGYFRYEGGPVVATGLLINYIIFAFKITDSSQYPLISAQLPKWAQTKRYRLEARSSVVNPTKDQIRLMVQATLADRFQLKLHTAMRNGRVYELTLRPSGPGPQLKPHQGDPLCSTVSATPSKPARTNAPAPSCGALFWKKDDGLHMRIMDLSMAEISGQLTLIGVQMGGLDQLPVVDRTGLHGKWDLDINFIREGSGLSSSADEPLSPPGPDLIQALSKQAGLILTKGTAEVPSYVIDQIESVSPN